MSDTPVDPRVTARALVQSLRGWHAAGLTHLVRPEPADLDQHSVPVESASAVSDSQSARPSAAAPSNDTSSMPPARKPTTAANPDTLEERSKRLQAVARKVAKCTRCEELAATRTQTVFGVGDPQARVMFIGEAPGADEDEQGEPFVGRSGQLLTRIIVACGWRREEIYICNILRCRPPNNRAPTDVEAANCREFLDAQISIVNPEYIVCWGSIAAQSLLGRGDPIGRLREQWFEHGRAKVLCTYHPSYLLRNPAAKKPVWEDMQMLLKAMGLTPPG